MSWFLFSILPVNFATTGPSWAPWMVADVAKGTWDNLEGIRLPQYWIINSTWISWDREYILCLGVPVFPVSAFVSWREIQQLGLVIE